MSNNSSCPVLHRGADNSSIKIKFFNRFFSCQYPTIQENVISSSCYRLLGKNKNIWSNIGMSDIHFFPLSDIIQKLVSTNVIYATVCSKPKRFEFTYHFKPERNPGTALSVKPDNDSY